MDTIGTMIPFHAIYSWLFKSFHVGSEIELLDTLVKQGYTKIMVVKRSWIFWLFTSWIPLFILGLSTLSIIIAYYSVEVLYIRNTIIIGNLLMSAILVISTLRYISHFREIHGSSFISTDMAALRKNLYLGDVYFINFFNWSVTNQIILFFTVCIELLLVFIFQEQLGNHVWVLTADTLVIFSEMFFLKVYRKKMIDLEMDYNIIVPGKIFFVNQSGVLSSIQTIESDKIKAIRSVFPNKIASFFNYGTIDVLTEGDTIAMMGTMSMFYVDSPGMVVKNIQSLLDENTQGNQSREAKAPPQQENPSETKVHSLDTRNKVRDVLR